MYRWIALPATAVQIATPIPEIMDNPSYSSTLKMEAVKSSETHNSASCLLLYTHSFGFDSEVEGLYFSGVQNSLHPHSIFLKNVGELLLAM
jgi:hypothetical protein